MACPIINSKWVVLHTLLQGSLITLVLWLIDSKQDCMIFWQSHHILLYNQQEASDTTCFIMQSHLILSYNQQLVSHGFISCSAKGCLIAISPTGSEWHCTSSGCLITSCPMTNRKWVTMQYSLIRRLHLGIQPTESQCQHIFRKYSPISESYSMTNRQWVSLLIILAFCSMTYREWVTLHIFLKHSLMTSCLVTNREWVTLHASEM